MSPAERPGSRYGIRPPSVLGNSGRASPGPNTSLDEGVDMARSDSNEQWVTVTSKFHFVDLAGSERVRLLSTPSHFVSCFFLLTPRTCYNVCS